MKGAKIVLGLIILYMVTFCIANVASCRSTSLTTTIFITVKAPPKSNLATNDKNTDMVEKLAKSQEMREPYIKAQTLDVTFLGEKIYTITGKL